MKKIQQKEHQKRLEQKKADLEQRNREKLAAKRASKDSSELEKPKPPSIEALYPKKIISGKYIASSAKSPSALGDFVHTKKNVSVSKLAEDTGYFGVKYLKDVASMKDSLVLSKGRVDDLVKKIEKGEDVTNTAKELIALRVNYLSTLKAVSNLHPFEDLAALAQEVSDNFSQYFAQRALTNDKLYKSLTSVEATLGDTLLRESKFLYASGIETSREKYQEAKEEFEKKVNELNEYIRANSNSKVRGAMRIHELAPNHFESLKKEVQKKTKFVIVNLERDLSTILSRVTEESLRADLFDEASKKFMTGSADNEFNVKLSNTIDAANAFAKVLGFSNFTQLKASCVSLPSESVPSQADFVEVVGNLREKFDVKKEVQRLSELKVTRLNNPILKKCYYNKTKFTAEDLKLFTPGFDVKQLSNLYYNTVRVNYATSDVENYTSLVSCLDALSKTAAGQIFGVEVVPEKLAPSETWSPLSVKKLNVVSNGKVVGQVYLDLFDREKTSNYDAYSADKAKVYTVASENGIKSVVIQMYLRDHIFSVSNNLSLEQFRSLSGAFGQALFHVLHESDVATSEKNILSSVIRKVFERLPQNASFLSNNLSHKGSRQPIPQEYVRQITTTPRQYPMDLLQQLVYSIYELEVFQPVDAAQSTPIEILTSIESRFCKPYTQLIPNLSFFTKRLFNLGSQPYYTDLYAELCAAHIFASAVSGEQFSEFSTALKSVMTQQAASAPMDSVRKLMGASKPDSTYFAKENELQ